MLEGRLKRTRDREKRAEIKAELDTPPFPVELRYLWTIFWRLRRRKGSGGFGGDEPIGWGDIDAFCRYSRTVLDEWDVSILEMLDDLFLGRRTFAGDQSED